MEKVKDAIRSILVFLDRNIYDLISKVYEMIIQVADLNIFDRNGVNEITNRVYILVAVFMLFKVAFAFVNYVINPESMNDKTKGVQKLIVRIVVMFAMLSMAPFVFDKAGELQSALLEENIVGAIVFGNNTINNGMKIQYVDDENCEKFTIINNGDFIALQVIRPFYQPNTLTGEIKDILCPSVADVRINTNEILTSTMVTAKVGSLNKNYSIEYKYLISTAVGILTLLILISFLFDVAVRTIKLSFLQLIAPIPIISYISPDSKNNMFQKWLKEYGSTWLSVFIRLLGLNFAILVIQVLTQNNYGSNGFLINLLLVIGALMFAKQLPKLIEGITGLKIDGGFNLNPIKKFQNEALGGKQITSLSGRAAGTTTGAIGGMLAGAKAGGEVGAPFRGALLGTFSGMFTGYNNKKPAFGKAMNDVYKNLTGNEMKRLTPTTYILSMNGKKAVSETKDYLGKAYKQLNNKQSDLNVSESRSAELGRKLSAKGYNYENKHSALADATERINNKKVELERLKSEKKLLNNNLLSANSEYDRFNNSLNELLNLDSEIAKLQDKLKNKDYTSDSGIIVGASHIINEINELEAKKNNITSSVGASSVDELRLKTNDAQIKFEEIKANHDRKIQEINSIDREIEEYNNDIADINAYAANRENEVKIRKDISDINKNIDTIKKEKAQRERFYHVDSAPQQDYKDARKKIDDRNKNDEESN